MSDASGIAIGAVLQQQIDGTQSHTFQKNYLHPKHDTAHLTENSWQSTAPFAISGIWLKVVNFLPSLTISR
jgi:hypothetical protein